MPVKSNFAAGNILTASDVNTYLTNGGLVYVNQTTATNTAALSWDNIFSSTYDTYRIVFQIAARSLGAYMRFQWRNSGGNANTNYVSKSLWSNIGLAGSTFADNDFAVDSVSIGPGGQQSATSWGIFTMDVGDVFAARYTSVTGSSSAVRSGTANYNTMFGSLHQTATSYTGLYLYASAGNFDVVATCYGYRKP